MCCGSNTQNNRSLVDIRQWTKLKEPPYFVAWGKNLVDFQQHMYSLIQAKLNHTRIKKNKFATNKRNSSTFGSNIRFYTGCCIVCSGHRLYPLVSSVVANMSLLFHLFFGHHRKLVFIWIRCPLSIYWCDVHCLKLFAALAFHSLSLSPPLFCRLFEKRRRECSGRFDHRLSLLLVLVEFLIWIAVQAALVQ